MKINELTEEDIARVNKYWKRQYLYSKWRSSPVFKVAKLLVLQKRRIFKILSRINSPVHVDNAIPLVERTLHIYYRHVHVKEDNASRFPAKHRPGWFSHESCFRNLVQTIKADPLASHVKIIVLFDGNVEEFSNDFIAKYRDNRLPNLDIQLLRSGSALNAFMIMLHMVRNTQMPDSDLIYLLENDYLHQHGWVSKVFELYESGIDFDYLSLYDHPDYYIIPKLANSTYRIVHSKSHHWRTAPSTCASFMLNKHTFDRDYEVFRACLDDRRLFEKLVGKNGRVLLSPVPSLSTHVMAEHLSPVVDWEKNNCI